MVEVGGLRPDNLDTWVWMLCLGWGAVRITEAGNKRRHDFVLRSSVSS